MIVNLFLLNKGKDNFGNLWLKAVDKLPDGIDRG